MASEVQSGVVALPAELGAVAAAAAAPQIAQVNVSQNSRMHIGPSFVNVTQNVHRDRVVKGRLLGLWLETRLRDVRSADGRRLRCSVAVFVCWALVVAIALAVYVSRLVIAARSHRIDLDLNETWYLRRGDWQARHEYRIKVVKEEPRIVIIGHSAGDACTNSYSCINRMLKIQESHLRYDWDDVGPNFVVGGEGGVVMEGRGAGVVGVMAPGWNSCCVSIMWVGDYRRGHDTPTDLQLQHVNVLLAALVAAGALHPDYVVLGQCQVVPFVYTPGVQLLERLGALSHFDKRNIANCLEWRDPHKTVDEATALPNTEPITNFYDNASTTISDDAIALSDETTMTPTDVGFSLEDGAEGTSTETIVSQ